VGLRANLNGYGIFRRYRGLDPGLSSPQRIAIPTTFSRPYDEGSIGLSAIGISANTISEDVNTCPKFLMIRREEQGGSGENATLGGIVTGLVS
jgi:hypothetical protein